MYIAQRFLMLYVFYITTTPYLPCNNNNINRKELYDFYYTAITLTTGYKAEYMYIIRSCSCSYMYSLYAHYGWGESLSVLLRRYTYT